MSTAPDDPIEIPGGLAIPRAELVMRASRSSGPGGQHVNTSSTRIELVWDVSTSPSLDDEQRVYLMSRLASRLDSQGRIRIVAQAERSQLRNRDAAVARFRDLVAAALRVPRRRKATRTPASAKRARLADKRKRSAVKRDRQRPVEE